MVVNGSHSSWLIVKSGVPSGLSARTSVFPDIVNDIHYVVFHSNTKVFADDVAIHNMIKTFEDWIRLQELCLFVCRQMAVEAEC